MNELHDKEANKSEKRKIVIFGAGKYGREALRYYAPYVEYFIDNDKELQGKNIEGVPIRSVDYYLDSVKKEHIVIASMAKMSMSHQLRDLGITDYEYFDELDTRIQRIDALVYNPYVDSYNRNLDEESYNRSITSAWRKEAIGEIVEDYHKRRPLFDMIELETTNQCNGACDFCPISRKNHKGKVEIMDETLFERIIHQLSAMDYSGRLALFCNNEPFTDPQIIDRHCYAREKVPHATMYLYTNGTLLTVDSFLRITKYLDELIIDNYHEKLQLIRPCQEIVDYCNEHKDEKWEKKVTIILRNPHEILSSRGGDAPNRSQIADCGDVSCVRPFHELIIKANGEVPLCCADPLGKNILGDARGESLCDIWYGKKYEAVRTAIYHGRKNWPHCKQCDYITMY